MARTIALTVAIGFLAALADVRSVAAGADGRSCESLASLTLPHTTVTLAQPVAAGSFTPPAGGRAGRGSNPFTNLPAFCRVAATIKPTSDSDIKIEVWLPAAGWNGKFQAVGNGGWAGVISYPALSEAVKRGYATSSTDTGHTGDGGGFALGHPEKFVDFAWRSEHEMTVKAKAIIETFYGTAARRAYWNGCSTGGRQGLIEAQRFPEDYDGIIAGASANPRSRLGAAHLAVHQALWQNPSRVIPSSKFPLVHNAVIEACDAIDGVKDRAIEDPTRCRFDAKVLECKGDDAPTCLTGPKVEAVRTILSPVRTRNGVEVFPGREPGAELGWAFFFGQPDPAPLVQDTFRYVVYKDPSWDWRTFDLDRDLARASASADVTAADAANPNLGAFVERGGKLLMYHGWSDPLVAPRASINYYNGVLDAMGGPQKTAEWIRLFMVPGMGHCGGGDGPNTFDIVGALEQWVEQRKAPQRIVASRISDGKVERTRPLCPYPQVATYSGSGSIDEAANFACAAPR